MHHQESCCHVFKHGLLCSFFAPLVGSVLNVSPQFETAVFSSLDNSGGLLRYSQNDDRVCWKSTLYVMATVLSFCEQ